MGDPSDRATIARFLRSPEGQEHLTRIRNRLLGHAISDVTFTNETTFIGMTLHFEGGDALGVSTPDLEVEALLEHFEEVLQREYFEDYPERKPDKEDGHGEPTV